MMEKVWSRGMYVLPNAFTTASLFAGFFAILQAAAGNFEAAVLAVFAAIAMDGLDGHVARLTHTESSFGAEYDSLSDMVSFGLAPAFVVYEWVLRDMGRLGWLAAFLFAACAALRLARFNVQLTNHDKRYFSGLPSPSAAALVAGFVLLFSNEATQSADDIQQLALVVTVSAGILMVSSIRYRSLKGVDLQHVWAWVGVAALTLLGLFTFGASKLLFAVFAVYAVSGLCLAGARLLRRIWDH